MFSHFLDLLFHFHPLLYAMPCKIVHCLNWDLFPLLRICGEIYWSTERGWKTKRWKRATFWWVLSKCSPWHDITHCRVFSCWASRRSGRWRWAGLRRRSPTWTGAGFQRSSCSALNTRAVNIHPDDTFILTMRAQASKFQVCVIPGISDLL